MENKKPLFVDKLFLYGTLKSDSPFYKLFSSYVLKNEPAYTYGTLAVDKNWPVFKDEGNYRVWGELVTVFNIKELLALLEPQYNDKVSKIIDVYKEGIEKPFKAYCFVYDRSIKGLEIIESGRWDNKQINYEEIT